MLTHLDIRNFAIIDNLSLEFGPNLTLLTGETGAGKSILVDALSLVLGERADTSLIRNGEKKAELSAEFSIQHLTETQQWLEEQDLDEDTDCVLRRVITAEGRSRAYINGRPVTSQLLKELGEQLVEIHGQHAHHQLLRTAIQLNILDVSAGCLSQREQLKSTFRDWQTVQNELTELKNATLNQSQRLDLLQHQTQELAALNLQPGELEEIEAEHHRQANMGRLIEHGQASLSCLYEADDTNTYQLLSRAIQSLESISDYDQTLADLIEPLQSASVTIQDNAYQLRRHLDNLEMDPSAFAALEARLASIHDLARKHQIPATELPEQLTKLQNELDQLDALDHNLTQIEVKLAELEKNYLDQSQKLSQKRRKAAISLAKKVNQSIRELGMPEAIFDIQIHYAQQAPFTASGQDQLAFLFSANPGQPASALNKVASGGELSRLSLALQVVTAGQQATPCMVFDEVDTGVGGAVAELIGRLLKQLSKHRQVLCVTHLPQVASFANQHMKIRKQIADKQTATEVDALNEPERIEELSRMLGGVTITDRTRETAREMLSNAREAS